VQLYNAVFGCDTLGVARIAKPSLVASCREKYSITLEKAHIFA
tara:strand:+ start:164 stop:292 length:129 start_codon:yes stop_codon:yes gene_type:complete